MAIETFTPYQTDRTLLLEDVNRTFRCLDKIMRESTKPPVLLPYRDLEGNERTYPVTPQTIFGLYLIRRSLYHDLVLDGQKDLADTIINHHERNL